LQVELEKSIAGIDGDVIVETLGACVPPVPLVAPDADMFRALAAWVARTASVGWECFWLVSF
jgi:hypothetical protein